MDNLFLTREEFAKATRTSVPTITRHLKAGIIPSVKLGSRVLIPASFLADLEAQARPEAAAR